MTLEKLALKWDNYLVKVRNRVDEALEEAKEASQPLVETTAYDTTAIDQAWSALKHQIVHKNHDKADSTWDNKMYDAFDDIECTSADISREGAKLDVLSDELELKYEMAYLDVQYAAAQKIESNLKAEPQKEPHCDGCGAPIDVPMNYIANNIKCNHCGFVNTYEPDDRARMFETYALPNLCRYATKSAYIKLEEKRMEITVFDSTRQSVSLEFIDELEALTEQYWTAYFNTLASYYPEGFIDTEKQVKDKMLYFFLPEAKRHNNKWNSKKYKAN